MNRQLERGFTIIEISLFVAISGLLAVALLTGWALSINGQRYKDSVDGLYAFLQQQYSFVYNVENGRGADLDCDSNSIVNEDGATPRGQSNCVLLGRYIRVTDGTNFQSFAVVGNESAGATSLSTYKPRVVDSNIGLSQQEYVIPWGAVAKGRDAGSTNALNIGIAVLRSPSNGSVYTYINSDTGNIVDLSSVVSTANQKEQYLCIDPGAGVAIQGNRRAVYLPKYAASQNSIETKGDGSGC